MARSRGSAPPAAGDRARTRARTGEWVRLLLAAGAGGLVVAIWFFGARPASRLASAPADVLETPAVAVDAASSVMPRLSGPAAAHDIVPMTIETPRAAGPPALEDIVSRALPAVVSVQVSDSNGSGFFIDRRRVVTNAHVLKAHRSATVRGVDGTGRSATLVATLPDYDLALLQVGGPAGAALPLGSLDAVRVGQEVLAIGSPLGVLQNTVTRGIVSGLRRQGEMILIQTDAAINHGNSGGPLLDRFGRVIGVTTMKGANAESIGFAVSVEHVKALVDTPRSTSPARPHRRPADQGTNR